MALRFIAQNRADIATLSVNPAENVTYPIANLKTVLRSEHLRTSGNNNQQLRAVWAAAQSIGAVALCRHTLTAAATWRVRLWSASNFTGGPLYDSGTVTAFDSTEMSTHDAIGDDTFRGYKNSVLWFTAVNALSMTVDLFDAGNADGYLRAERLFAGPYYELAWNFDWGHPLSFESPTTQSLTMGGSRLSQNNGPVLRQLSLPFDKVGPTDRNYLADLSRVKELSGDVFLSAWPGVAGRKERDYQMWAKIVSMQGIEQPLLNYYSTELTFGEC